MRTCLEDCVCPPGVAREEEPGNSAEGTICAQTAAIDLTGIDRQLSTRSVVSGMLIGAIMSVSNLYVGLKTGWSIGVTITSSTIAYAVFKALEVIIPRYRRDPLTLLENNTVSAVASSAGYMASAGLVSAIPCFTSQQAAACPGGG